MVDDGRPGDAAARLYNFIEGVELSIALTSNRRRGGGGAAAAAAAVVVEAANSKFQKSNCHHSNFLTLITLTPTPTHSSLLLPHFCLTENFGNWKYYFSGSQILYRDGLKSGPLLLSKSQAGLGRKFSQPRDHFLAQVCRQSTLRSGCACIAHQYAFHDKPYPEAAILFSSFSSIRIGILSRPTTNEQGQETLVGEDYPTE